MKVRRIKGGLLLALALIPACSNDSTVSSLPTVEAPAEMTLFSRAIGEHAPMATRYTCDGKDVSPALEWSKVPDAGEYVITVIDVTAPHGLFVHWLIWNIPPETTSLAEGAVPDEAIEGVNGFGDSGYGGPCPPEGDDGHRYVFTVYAVEAGATDDLAEGASAEELLASISCCALAAGGLNGEYQRP